MIKRESMVTKSKQDLKLREEMANHNYNDNIQRRARHVHEMITEHQKNEIATDKLAKDSLKKGIYSKELDHIKRTQRREERFERLKLQEMARLKEILAADKEISQFEKSIFPK